MRKPLGTRSGVAASGYPLRTADATTSISVADAGDEARLVWIGESHLLHIDGSFTGRRALCGLEDEPGAVIDVDLLGLAGYGILDRLERDAKTITDADRALQAIDLEI